MAFVCCNFKFTACEAQISHSYEEKTVCQLMDLSYYSHTWLYKPWLEVLFQTGEKTLESFQSRLCLTHPGRQIPSRHSLCNKNTLFFQGEPGPLSPGALSRQCKCSRWAISLCMPPFKAPLLCCDPPFGWPCICATRVHCGVLCVRQSEWKPTTFALALCWQRGNNTWWFR